MTDKERIRKEVEKIARSINPYIPDEEGKNSEYEAGRFAMVAKIMQIIDSMQEETVKKSVDEAMADVEEKAKLFTEAHKSESADEILSKMRGEEPVSEDLEEAAISYAATGEFLDNGKEMIDFQVEKAFKAGAKWQKAKEQSTIELAEDHAMLAGMEKMKDEMMEKATDVTVHIDAGGYPYIPQLELYDYDKDVPLAKEGDKYKVILIKEE